MHDGAQKIWVTTIKSKKYVGKELANKLIEYMENEVDSEMADIDLRSVNRFITSISVVQGSDIVYAKADKIAQNMLDKLFDTPDEIIWGYYREG